MLVYRTYNGDWWAAGGKIIGFMKGDYFSMASELIEKVYDVGGSVLLRAAGRRDVYN